MMTLKNVTKQYNDQKVVDSVNLNLPEGKIIAFIGANGAGKSTLVSMVSRLIKANKGDISIDGTSLPNWKDKELAKNISVLNQSNHLNIRLTVKELVSFGRFPYSGSRLTKEDKKKVAQAIAYMGIEDLQHKYLDELSGGQQQMAYIAMVIAQDTKYILLDEPLNNLDMKRSVQIMKCLRKLVDEVGKTVLVVIHDINFVSCYADYVVAMKHGQVIGADSNGEMITDAMLKQIYDMDIHVSSVGDERICVYYS